MDRNEYNALRFEHQQKLLVWQASVLAGKERVDLLEELKCMAGKLEQYSEAYNLIPRD